MNRIKTIKLPPDPKQEEKLRKQEDAYNLRIIRGLMTDPDLKEESDTLDEGENNPKGKKGFKDKDFIEDDWADYD
jgi:hypothetical protein